MSHALIVCAAPASAGEAFYRDSISAHEGPVIAVDGGAALCLDARRHPDVLVGDLDSIAPDVLRDIESSAVPVRRAPVEKDVTDLDLALDVASEMRASRATVTAAWSGRLDHTLAAIGTVFSHSTLVVELSDPGMSGWLLTREHRPSIVLAGPGATFSLFSIDENTVVSCTGARYPLEMFTLSPLSSLGLSNIISGPRATITLERGRLLVLSHATPDAPEARSVMHRGE